MKRPLKDILKKLGPLDYLVILVLLPFVPLLLIAWVLRILYIIINLMMYGQRIIDTFQKDLFTWKTVAEAAEESGVPRQVVYWMVCEIADDLFMYRLREELVPEEATPRLMERLRRKKPSREYYMYYEYAMKKISGKRSRGRQLIFSAAGLKTA